MGSEEREGKPAHPYAKSPDWIRQTISVVGVLGAIFALLTLLAALFAVRDMLGDIARGTEPMPANIYGLVLLAFFWGVLPPIWFWAEYWWLYMRHGDGSDAAFAQFKHNQTRSAAIWAGILVFLGVILSAAL